MIASVSGIIQSKDGQKIVVEAGPIGYEIFVPTSLAATLPEVGQSAKIFTYQVVREDSTSLYGFPTREERNLYGVLLSASGVGPKLGMAIMSSIPMEELIVTITRGNVDRLKSISGVGLKTAQRIVIELKEKMAKIFAVTPVETFGGMAAEDQPVLRDALSALMSLGYSAREAREAIQESGVDLQTAGLEELLKQALKSRI